MCAHDKSSPGGFQVHAHLHFDSGCVNPVASSMMQLREQKSGRFQPFGFSWNFQCLLWHLSFRFSVISHLGVLPWISKSHATAAWSGGLFTAQAQDSAGDRQGLGTRKQTGILIWVILTSTTVILWKHWQCVSSATEARTGKAKPWELGTSWMSPVLDSWHIQGHLVGPSGGTGAGLRRHPGTSQPIPGFSKAPLPCYKAFLWQGCCVLVLGQ